MSASPTAVFAALADPTRWQVLNLLAEHDGGTATSLAEQMPVSRVAVVKHLGVLGGAGLVDSRRDGREVRFSVVTDALQDTAMLLARLASEWDTRLAAIKQFAEADTPPTTPDREAPR
ncbi:MAG: helix-turn-helix transcriptional regulator [Solirubrobacteraceae bacterium]|nr:helix-turn-helix transcriptional regulator [Solirubrobacteraceae bacterium]